MGQGGETVVKGMHRLWPRWLRQRMNGNTSRFRLWPNGWNRVWPWRFGRRREARAYAWPFRLWLHDRDKGEKDCLERDLWRAHRDWQLARQRLDQALDADEVDYAVLMLEASEKRYGMMIKKAKAAGLERNEWRPDSSTKPPRASATGEGQKGGPGWTKDG